MSSVTVLKLGGELLETAESLKTMAAAITDARRHTPRLVVVHGGGRTIDAALKRAAITPRLVEGLRITDEDTLEVVVSVLAGWINTRFVAALNAAGTPAVGLTGVDAQLLPVEIAAPLLDAEGRPVSLGLVGEPVQGGQGEADVAIHLVDTGYVPVVASIAADATGDLLNVNADTFAAALAIALRAERLVIAGTTAGVLDRRGATIPAMTVTQAEAFVGDGSATAGMIAKLRACTRACERGVGAVIITEGSMVGDALAGRRVERATVIQGVLASAGAVHA